MVSVFENSNLESSILTQANLAGADFSHANLHHASLLEADVWNANFNCANLRGANMLCRRIEDIKLEGALFDSDTIWPTFFNPLEYGAIKS